MDVVFAQLLLQKTLSAEEWLVWSHLAAVAMVGDSPAVKTARFGGKLICDESASAISNTYNINLVTVERLLEKFIALGWAKAETIGYCLGELVDGRKKWYCANKLSAVHKPHVASTPSATEQLRALIARKKAAAPVERIKKISVFARAQILKTVATGKKASPAARILDVLKVLHVNKFNNAYPMARDAHQGHFSPPKEYGYINRTLMYVGNDEGKLIEILKWVYDNWDTIKARLGWLGPPNMSLFSTASMFKQISKMYSDSSGSSVIKNVGNRYDENVAKVAKPTGF